MIFATLEVSNGFSQVLREGVTVPGENPISGRLLTAPEVASRLKVTAKTVRTWARAGRIPSFQLSQRGLRFDWEAVMRALASPADNPGDASSS
jgi:excisionase family DNA binding protein